MNRHRQPGAAGLLRYGVRAITAGVGLASEGIHAYRHRSKSRDGSDGKVPAQEVVLDNDEEQWALDDAQDELLPSDAEDPSPQPASPSSSTPVASSLSTSDWRSTEKVITAFTQRYPPPPSPGAPLSAPVVLPQRRPKQRARGFIRAYAPALEVCGIGQAEFLDFLAVFERTSQASPLIQAVNLAGFATLALPTVTGLIVNVAIQVAVRAATEVHGRSRYAARTVQRAFKRTV